MNRKSPLPFVDAMNQPFPNPTEPLVPNEIMRVETVLLQINTDFTAKGLTSLELTAIVGAWQAGAISQATMFDLFRKGEVLPTGRTDNEEKNLIGQIGHGNPTGVFPNAATTPGNATTPAAVVN